MKPFQILLSTILLAQSIYGEPASSDQQNPLIDSDEEKLDMKELLFLIEGPPTPPNPTLEMVKELNKKIDELAEQLTHIEDSFSEAQKNQNEIQQLNAQIVLMTKRLKKAENDLTTTQENTQMQMTQLHSQVIDLSHQLKSAETALNRSEKNNERLANQLHTQISELTEQLNKAESSLSKAQENEWRVAQLYSQVVELTTQLTKAEQSLAYKEPQEKAEVEPCKEAFEPQQMENCEQQQSLPEQLLPVVTNEPSKNVLLAPEKKPIAKRAQKKRGFSQIKKRKMISVDRADAEDLKAKIEELNKCLNTAEKLLSKTQLSNEEDLVVDEEIPLPKRKQRGFLKAKK